MPAWAKIIRSDNSYRVKYIYCQRTLKDRTERIKYLFQKLQPTSFIGSNVTLIETIVKSGKRKVLVLQASMLNIFILSP